ncbi:DNA polymerase theta isoform X1 [Drosophila miranda]|uniref:DNA polymerase theta isoform X1 n=1 Tax=Drosophila miranda TaxID=7229 RepID=UPI00143F9693|nr:DNA polymerase theta isoform X1 [Drosophila miranda]
MAFSQSLDIDESALRELDHLVVAPPAETAAKGPKCNASRENYSEYFQDEFSFVINQEERKQGDPENADISSVFDAQVCTEDVCSERNEEAEEPPNLDESSFLCPVRDEESSKQLEVDLFRSRTTAKGSPDFSRTPKSRETTMITQNLSKMSPNQLLVSQIPPDASICQAVNAPPNVPVDVEALKSLSAWNLPHSILAEYKRKGVVQMFDWQAECLSKPRVVFEHCNLVYSAPTSAGKTLVSEILLLKSVLERGKKVLVILPFISVVREKTFYLQDLLTPAGHRVEGFFGGYTPPGGFDSIDVAICTIEKANSIVNKLLEQGKLDVIGTVVVDEVHLISEKGRGYILELLLAKILYMSRKNALQIQVITMSATLANVELLRRWLDAELYITNYRPVALQEMIKVGTKIYDHHLEFQRDITQQSEVPCLTNDSDHVAQLCIETLLEGCSVIVFCPSRDWCESLAVQLAIAIHGLIKAGTELSRRLRSNLNPEAIEDVKQQLRDIPTGLDSTMSKAVTYACAFHHAGLTTEERDIVEACFKAGALKVLVATSTLSSGVNLPARRVIIRSPLFGKNQMSSLTYRQMIGRAGRTGKDTLGESILICTESNQRVGRDLVQAQLQPISSCLEMDESTHLKRALLEVISSGVASTRQEIDSFVNCTLLSAEKAMAKLSEEQQQGAEDCSSHFIDDVLDFLIDYEFIRHQVDEEAGTANYVGTHLGAACLASSMPPGDGLILFAELQKARRTFVLDTDLHAVYLVTPYSVCYQLQDLDWLLYLDMWEKLSPAMKRVGELVGVKEAFLIRAMRGQSKLDYKQMQIHKRFYTALALKELINETPINVVAHKFKCNRGVLQGLQQISSTFAGIVTAFCKSLKWSTIALIVEQFKDRLFFGIHIDLIDLMQLPDLSQKRARAIYDAGFTSVVELAGADALVLEKVLYNSLSFDSAKQHDHENAHEAAKRNMVRNIFITGKAGMTVAEAAKLLIDQAQKYMQHKIGVDSIKWNQNQIESGELPKSADSGMNVELHMSLEDEQSQQMRQSKRKSTDKEGTITPPKITMIDTTRDFNAVENIPQKSGNTSKSTDHIKEMAQRVPFSSHWHTPKNTQKTNNISKGVPTENPVQKKDNYQMIMRQQNAVDLPASTQKNTQISNNTSKGVSPSVLKEKLNRVPPKKVQNAEKSDEKTPCPSKISEHPLQKVEHRSVNARMMTRQSTVHHIEQKAVDRPVASNLKNNISKGVSTERLKEILSDQNPLQKIDNTPMITRRKTVDQTDEKENRISSPGFDEEKPSTSRAVREELQKKQIAENRRIAVMKLNQRRGQLETVPTKDASAETSAVAGKTQTPRSRSNPRVNGIYATQSLESERKPSAKVSPIEQDIFSSDDSFLLSTGVTAALTAAESKQTVPTSNSDADEIPSSQPREEEGTNNHPTTPHTSRLMSIYQIMRSQRLQSPRSSPSSTGTASCSARSTQSSGSLFAPCVTTKDSASKNTPNGASCTELAEMSNAAGMNSNEASSIKLSDMSAENSLMKHPLQLNSSHVMSYSTTDDTALSFDRIEIIDMCANRQLFQMALKEILAASRCGFSVGLESQAGKAKPLIGANLLVNQLAAAEQRDTVAGKQALFQVDESSFIAGLSFCLADNVVYYMCMQEEEGQQVPTRLKVQELCKLMDRPELTLLVHDAKEQLKALLHGVPQLHNIGIKVEDPKVGNWLLEPDKTFSFKNMCQQFAPECTALANLCGSGRGYSSHGLDSSSAILPKLRASIEACVTVHILKGQIENLERIGQLLKIFREVEMPIQIVLCRMECVGFPAKHQRMGRLIKHMLDTLNKVEIKIYKMHGSKFNLGSTQAVANVLGLHRKPHGRVSTSRQVLEKLGSPISELILNHRKLNMQIVKGMQPLIRCCKANRIHGHSITHTATGRISMSEPNLQNVAKDFDIRMGPDSVRISCRSVFKSMDEKRCLLSADFCQLEMRILAHLSQDKALVSVMNSPQDLFTAIAAHWNHITEAEVTEQIRSGTKQICYGIVYGMGMRSLGDALQCTESEAQLICEQFHQSYPGIRAYTEKVLKFARKCGYVETITGRRRYLDHINSGEQNLIKQAERQAVNTTIQGSAADIAKRAILDMDKNIGRYWKKLGVEENSIQLVLHIHDELVYEVPEAKAKRIAKFLGLTLESIGKGKLTVPLKESMERPNRYTINRENIIYVTGLHLIKNHRKHARRTPEPKTLGSSPESSFAIRSVAHLYTVWLIIQIKTNRGLMLSMIVLFRVFRVIRQPYIFAFS